MYAVSLHGKSEHTYACQNDMSFEKFINEHKEDIKYLKSKRILYQEEVDKLIVDNKAISGITVDALEVTLLGRLLDNLCPDLFMDDGSKTLQDFLKKNHHDIYHLFKCNQRCCQCTDHYQFPVTEELLKENQYKNMFESENASLIIFSAETEYISTRYWNRNINFF
jgi:hypothetical protein